MVNTRGQNKLSTPKKINYYESEESDNESLPPTPVKVKQEPVEEKRPTPKKLVFYSDSEESDNESEYESENDSSSSGSETSGSESGSESDSEYSSSDDSGSEYSSDDASSTATGDVVDLTGDSDEDDDSEDDPDYEYESQSDVEFSDDDFHELSVLASQVLRWKHEHNISYDDVLLIHSMLMLRFHNKDI